jgi:hypothetical protein
MVGPLLFDVAGTQFSSGSWDAIDIEDRVGAQQDAAHRQGRRGDDAVEGVFVMMRQVLNRRDRLNGDR